MDFSKKKKKRRGGSLPSFLYVLARRRPAPTTPTRHYVSNSGSLYPIAPDITLGTLIGLI